MITSVSSARFIASLENFLGKRCRIMSFYRTRTVECWPCPMSRMNRAKLSLLILTIAALVTAKSHGATNITIYCDARVTNSATFLVPTGQVARVLSAASSYGSPNGGALNVLFPYATSNGTYIGFTILEGELKTTPRLPTVVGPASIQIQSQGSGYCTIELTVPPESFTPSTAVVIPSEPSGPVNIILECSTDLVSWTAALPGSYGTSTAKRFFRVRAERSP